MIVILSPSKTQEYAERPADEHRIPYTIPALLTESEALITILQRKSVDELAQLMGVSDSLSRLNHERYQHFTIPLTLDNARQALMAFQGDVYTDIATKEYEAADFDFAQKHLRIISGLYGLLRPLDLIQPYRLEMKTRLANPRGSNLYQFWGDRITDLLNEAFEREENSTVINLASQEYSKAINDKELRGTIVTPVFREDRHGTLSTVAIYAKRARGKMANFIIKQRITVPEKLKVFQESGYEYQPTLSSRKEWVFVR